MEGYIYPAYQIWKELLNKGRSVGKLDCRALFVDNELIDIDFITYRSEEKELPEYLRALYSNDQLTEARSKDALLEDLLRYHFSLLTVDLDTERKAFTLVFEYIDHDVKITIEDYEGDTLLVSKHKLIFHPINLD